MASRTRQIAYLDCRTFGHAWDEYNPTGEQFARRDGFYDRITVRCTRCTTTRHDYIDREGQVTFRQYKHPEGYRIAKDETPSRAVMRLLLHGHPIPRGIE
jgi:hypothetical protein